MGPNKYVHLTFLVAGILAAYLLLLTGDWVWSYFAKPNEMILTGTAFLVAGAAALYAYRNERAFGLVTEVTRELQKVTWPSKKETYAATIVVLVTVIIASLILSVFDAIWSYLTNRFLG